MLVRQMKPSKKSKRDGCQFYFIALILFSQTYPDMPSVRSSNVLVGHPLFTMGSKCFSIQTQNLLNLVQTCSNLFKLVQTCLNLSEIGLNLSRHAKCSFKQHFGQSPLHKWGQNLFEVAFKNLFNLLKLVLKSSILSEIVQIGLNFSRHANFFQFCLNLSENV